MLALLQNNIYLSILVGVIVALFLYIDNRKQPKNKQLETASYIKIFLVTGVLTYLILYFRTKTFDIPKMTGGGTTTISTPEINLKETMSNVDISEPTF